MGGSSSLPEKPVTASEQTGRGFFFSLPATIQEINASEAAVRQQLPASLQQCIQGNDINIDAFRVSSEPKAEILKQVHKFGGPCATLSQGELDQVERLLKATTPVGFGISRCYVALGLKADTWHNTAAWSEFAPRMQGVKECRGVSPSDFYEMCRVVSS